MRNDLAIEILKKIADVPTASFYEDMIDDTIERIYRELFETNRSLSLEYDIYGNMMIHYSDASQTRSIGSIAYVAHTDHPALHVTPLVNGTYEAKMMGGLNTELIVGTRVVLHGDPAKQEANIGKGIVANALDLGSSNPSRRYIIKPTEPNRHESFQHARFATLDIDGLHISNSIIRAPVLDDYASIAMSLAALKGIADLRLPVDMYVVFHKAEEVGLIGAYCVASNKLLPSDTFVYSIETSSYLAKRNIDDLEPVKIAGVGEGIILRTGDRITPTYNIEALCLGRSAALNNFKPSYQQIRMFGGNCEASLYYALGYRAAGICLPLIGWHNNGKLEGRDEMVPEGVHLDDVLGGAAFMVKIAETLCDRPELYRNLGKHDITPEHVRMLASAKASFNGYQADNLI